MSIPDDSKADSAMPRRRYLVHLLSVSKLEDEICGYMARIRPYAPRSRFDAQARERAFADECELIAVVNPLLPAGSDVRDVFDHIESPNGFFYLLHLSTEEASQLGWIPS